MVKTIHRANTRGTADFGWLKANYSFSFANYYGPSRVHFGLLRVFNDDHIAPGMGFGTHPHDNMEIVTIPLEGSLAHKDSMGSEKTISPNEVQIMSAGTGVTHSEYNHSQTEPVKLFQLWVFPKERNIQPRYDQKLFDPSERKNKWQYVVSPKHENALWINQDAYFSLGNFEKEQQTIYHLNNADHGVYLMVIQGSITVAGENLERRDAIGISGINELQLKINADDTRLLLIEVQMN